MSSGESAFLILLMVIFIIGSSVLIGAMGEGRGYAKAAKDLESVLAERDLAYYSVDVKTGMTQFLWKSDDKPVELKNKE